MKAVWSATIKIQSTKAQKSDRIEEKKSERKKGYEVHKRIQRVSTTSVRRDRSKKGCTAAGTEILHSR